jgi:excinuclease UvrABC nuclease subunit
MRSTPGRIGFVYKCYDADDALIYVGSCTNAANRMQGHERGKQTGGKGASAWWPEVVSIEWEMFPSIGLARATEDDLIFEHRPKYNRHGNGRG